MSTGQPLVTLPIVHSSGREQLVARARLLAWVGLAWHVAEAAIAIVAGVAASSIALVGFGADSVIEAGAGLVVGWLMAGVRSAYASAERGAEQLRAASFVVLAASVSVESAGGLVGSHGRRV